MKMGFGIIWNKNLYETQFGKEKLSTLVTSVSFFSNYYYKAYIL